MPTPAQSAFAEGFAALAAEHGETWSFGTARFTGVASAIQSTEPRLPGSSDERFKLRVRTSDLPTVRPVRGDEIVRSGAHFRISSKPTDEDTGNTVFELTPAS